MPCKPLLPCKPFPSVQVSAVLDRKEALLMQLRNMNDEAEAGLHLDATGRHTEAFQVQYAQIVLELKQVKAPCCVLTSCVSVHCSLHIYRIAEDAVAWGALAHILLSVRKG